jgi:hypothetical protein
MRRHRLGFGWRASPVAPADFPALVREYETARISRLPFRVSCLHSDSVIYDSSETNLALRFWHDTNHVLHGLTFALDDERELADRHLQALRAEGFGPTTFEHQLIHADIFGQVYFQIVTGSFVRNQLRFDTNCVLFGVDEAVAQEYSALRLQASRYPAGHGRPNPE